MTRIETKIVTKIVTGTTGKAAAEVETAIVVGGRGCITRVAEDVYGPCQAVTDAQCFQR